MSSFFRKFSVGRSLVGVRSPSWAKGLEHFAWLLGREPLASDLDMGLTQSLGEVADDENLIRRVMRAYALAHHDFSPSGSGWDKEFFALKKELHDSLTADTLDKAVELLRNPGGTTHFWGFDAIAKAPPGEVEPHELVLTRLNKRVPWKRLYALWVYDSVKNLAEAVGVKRAAYPEVDVSISGVEERLGVEEMLDSIEAEIGVVLRFPNPYSGELGIPTTRGVVGFRSVQAIYQAWRIRELSRGSSGYRVMEIGAGLGRTAYFASTMGVSNYTIIDIPLTGAAQGYFLGRSLGADKVALHGESGEGKVRIHSPSSSALLENYDLIVNVDSFPEMDVHVAQGYWAVIKKQAKQFLSVNHEFNPVTVRSLYTDDDGIFVSRHPYWMRRGYIEELVTFGGR